MSLIIIIIKKCHDNVNSLPTHTTCEWLYVELSPLKHFLAALSTKWMYVFANYLREQVRNEFIERIFFYLLLGPRRFEWLSVVSESRRAAN